MKINKKKKYIIFTFGCQMNYSDSERISSIFEKSGYILTKDINNADLIVYNSCSVRQSAEDRILGLKKQIEKLKIKNNKLRVVLTGCMVRRYWDKNVLGSKIKNQQWQKNLKKRMPWVDLIIEINQLNYLPKLLNITKSINESIIDYLSIKPKYNNKFQAFIPISTGCDHFCTFCIVPYARGKELCRKASDIIKEVKDLVKKGYKDITLLGQTVNRWTNPAIKNSKFDLRISKINTQPLVNLNNSPKDFLQLLQVLDNIKGDWWYSFMSSHPNYMTKELINFLSQSKHFRPYIHFAMQSGDNQVLKKMNRKYSIEDFIMIIKYIRKKIPKIGISTDVIVGFPGETEEQFLKTAKVMKMLKFDMAFLSEFSSRKNTSADLMRDNISHMEKERRKKYLNDKILAKTALENNKKLIRKNIKTLIQSKTKNGLFGKTDNFKDILIINSKDIRFIGNFVNVQVTNCTSWTLKGKIIIPA